LNLALFDLDNTLLRGDSDYNWSKFLIKHGLLDSKEHEKQNEIFYQDYKDGCLDIYKFCEFQFRPFTLIKRDQLNQLREQYVAEVIKPLVTKKSLNLVKSHQKNNDLCIIITATNSFITKPIASLFDVDILIGTDPEEVDGNFTGHVSGTPSFQEGKITRLKAWLQEHQYSFDSFKQTYFYSDSQNDLPLLNSVSNPICVNPDTILESKAKENNWPIISLDD